MSKPMPFFKKPSVKKVVFCITVTVKLRFKVLQDKMICFRVVKATNVNNIYTNILISYNLTTF